jgi:hypothetical protein
MEHVHHEMPEMPMGSYVHGTQCLEIETNHEDAGTLRGMRATF